MLSTRGKVGRSASLLLLRILLPSLDVFSDLGLILTFHLHGHPHYAALLLAPFLANYLLTWLLWWRRDGGLATMLACLLSAYPQARAAKVLRQLWTRPAEGLRAKRRLEREVAELEVLVEAVPTVLVMTYLQMRVMEEEHYSQYEPGHKDHDPDNTYALVVGRLGSREEALFYFSFLTSILTASLGLAKVLLSGVCRVLGGGGRLGGLATPRFLHLVVACGASLVAKGLGLAMATADWSCEEGSTTIHALALALATMFLPGLLLATCTSWHPGILTTFLSHPSILLLPTFTHFTFASSTFSCGSRAKAACVDLMFSERATMANTLLSLVGHLVCSLLLSPIVCTTTRLHHATILLPAALAGALATLTFLLFTRCSCSPAMEYGVLRPSDPSTPHLLSTTATGELVVVAQVEVEEVEQVEDVEQVGEHIDTKDPSRKVDDVKISTDEEFDHDEAAVVVDENAPDEELSMDSPSSHNVEDSKSMNQKPVVIFDRNFSLKHYQFKLVCLREEQ